MRLITLTDIAVSGEAMFDGITDTQTETAEAIIKTFSVGGFNAVAILNCYGVSASLEIGGDTQTISLIRDSIKDWWDYFFAKSRIGGDFVFYFPVQAAGANATLTISYPGGTAKCGLCVTGSARHVMTTRQDVKIGISDYSRITTNTFGESYLLQGRWAKRADVGGFVYNTDLDLSYRDVVKNRGIACIFDYNEYPDSIAYDLPEYVDIERYVEASYYDITAKHTSVNAYQSLIVYGFTEDFYIQMPGPTISNMKHESQGLA